MFTGWVAAGHAVLTSSVLSPSLPELVILRTGHLINCPCAIAQTPLHAAPASLTDKSRDLHSAAASARAASTTSNWRSGLTKQFLLTKQVDAALFNSVHQGRGTAATIELLMLISRWAGLALMINALETDVDTTARISIPHPQK